MSNLTDISASDQSAIERLDRLFALQAQAFQRNSNPGADERIELMRRVPDMLRKYRQKILAALDADFAGHSHDQSDLLEILGMFERAKFNIDHVRKWMRPIPKASNPITQGSSKAYITQQSEI